MNKLLKDIITDISGEDYDISRILLLIFGLAFVGFTGYDLWHGGHFDPSNFGLGAGGLLGGGGAGIGMKSKLEG